MEKILLILNASANFVYYCFAGREFRRQFVKTLFCCFSNQTHPSATEVQGNKKYETENITLHVRQKNYSYSLIIIFFLMNFFQELEINEQEIDEDNSDEIEKWRLFVANIQSSSD